ncbi:hypothetical protein ACWCP6_03000 [Streptomyces sp. NPDC002004]
MRVVVRAAGALGVAVGLVLAVGAAVPPEAAVAAEKAVASGHGGAQGASGHGGAEGAPVRGRAQGVSVAEADLAFHGIVSMDKGVMSVTITPQNYGPSDLDEAAVRLRWSVPLAARQTMPAGCVRTGARTVLCKTGAVDAGGTGPSFSMRARLAGTPPEASLRIETAWNGGAKDRNPQNNEHDVLALETGDLYVF